VFRFEKGHGIAMPLQDKEAIRAVLGQKSPSLPLGKGEFLFASIRVSSGLKEKFRFLLKKG